jgi:hypothetical protein
MPRPPMQDTSPPALPTADTPLAPSKSQRKRDARAVQALGEQLVALSAAQLARLDLPEALHEAVVAGQRMRSHGARRRQMQYIGKVQQIRPLRSAAYARRWRPGRSHTASRRGRLRRALCRALHSRDGGGERAGGGMLLFSHGVFVWV